MQRGFLTILVASLFTTPSAVILSAQTVVAAPSPSTSAQEVSLASLGLATQTVHGSAASVAVAFPPPASALAASGSYLRVFFSHSPQSSAGSSLHVLANGEEVTAATLTPSTAAGSVFVVALPEPALNTDTPNLIEFVFLLTAGDPATASALFGRVAEETALHYELAARIGTIEAHPYSLMSGSLGGSLAGAALGLVLPTSPDTAELAAGLRLVADASRLLRPARLRLHLVADHQQPWLEAGGTPALLVGRVDHLPGGAAVLEAAGFTPGARGWRAPGSLTETAPDDGMIAAAVSPWDHSSPIIVVTGGSGRGVARAAQALLDAGQSGLSGHAAVVTEDPAPVVPVDGHGALPTFVPDTATVAGPGEHVILFGLPVSGVAGSIPAGLHLTFTFEVTGSPAVATPVVDVEVNGRFAATPGLAIDSQNASSVDVDLRRGLHPGVNGIAINLQLPVGYPRAHVDPSISPLPGPGSLARLDDLPYPFLGGRQGANPQLILAGLDTATLSGAVSAMAGLGWRATMPPGPLTVVVLRGDVEVAFTSGSMMVIGGRPGQSLQLRRGALDRAAISPPPGAESAGVGWIEELDLPGDAPALWLGGDPGMLANAGLALGKPDLHGQAAFVGPDGAARNVLVGRVGSLGTSLAIEIARLLPLVGVTLLLALLAVALRRRPTTQRELGEGLADRHPPRAVQGRPVRLGSARSRREAMFPARQAAEREGRGEQAAELSRRTQGLAKSFETWTLPNGLRLKRATAQDVAAAERQHRAERPHPEERMTHAIKAHFYAKVGKTMARAGDDAVVGDVLTDLDLSRLLVDAERGGRAL